MVLARGGRGVRGEIVLVPKRRTTVRDEGGWGFVLGGVRDLEFIIISIILYIAVTTIHVANLPARGTGIIIGRAGKIITIIIIIIINGGMKTHRTSGGVAHVVQKGGESIIP